MRSGRWVVAVCVIVTLGLAGCGVGNGNDRNGKEKRKSGSVAVGPASDCTAPTVQDRYIGFKIGRPKGWTLDSTGGAIVVKEDPAGKTVALVYPVVLKGGQAPSDLFRSYTSVLDATAKADGGGLSFNASRRSGSEIEADVSGSFAGVRVKGQAKVTRSANQTVFAAYWAPVDRFSDRQETLSSIVSCYEKKAGIAMRVRSGQFFSVAAPPGWRVTGESQNGVDIAAPGDAGSVDLGYVVNSPGSSTPEEFRDLTFNLLNLGTAKVVATQELGSQTDRLGTAWRLQASEFRGVFEGKDVRGVMTVAVGNASYGTYAALSSIRVARVEAWDELAGALAAVQDSIKITSTSSPGAGVSLPANHPLDDPLTGSYEYRGQVEDKLSQDWQEAIMGYDNVESPTTGEHYQAPLNSYDPTGSDGPGYYRSLPNGDQEKLVESP